MKKERESQEQYIARVDAMKKMRKTGTILDFQGHIGTAVEGREDEAFNPNWHEADHPQGVLYYCPWEDPFAGFPEHARRCARALDNTGMPTKLLSLDPSMQLRFQFETGGKDAFDLIKDYRDLLDKTIQRPLVEIYQVVTNDELLQRLTTHRFIDPKALAAINRFRIISCVFERDRVSDHAVAAFNKVGAVWVANYQDKQMLKRCGVERVGVVPIPFFPDDPLLKQREKKRNPDYRRRPGPPRFYHIGKWEHRKAHHEMLGAFLIAFKPGEAKLYFKTSTKAPDFGDYPSSPEESVHRWMKDVRVQGGGWTIELANQNIHLIKQRIPAAQIRRLHELGDVYLSLSRGEGFDMPAYDSQLAGNLMVYTPSGGPQMYAGIGNIEVAAAGWVRCHPFYKWEPEARYLGWNMHDAAKAMKHAAGRVMAGEIYASDLSRLRADNVGQTMRKLIDQVLEDGRCWVEEQRKKP